MHTKRNIIIIAATIILLAAAGINLGYVYNSRKNNSESSNISYVTTSTITPTPTTAISDQASKAEAQSTNVAIDEQTEEVLQDVDNAMKDLDSLSSVPDINQADFQ